MRDIKQHACDGAHYLTLKVLPNQLEDDGFTVCNESAVGGRRTREVVTEAWRCTFQEERQRIGVHLDGIARRRFTSCAMPFYAMAMGGVDRSR